jgi:CubicO group peptidase (beta-lactamase class C family)
MDSNEPFILLQLFVLPHDLVRGIMLYRRGDVMADDEVSFRRSEVTLANWREHPFSQWAFQHVPELVPVAEITAASALEEPVTEPGLIASLSIHLPDGSEMTALEHLKRSGADCFVMMRDGVVLDEWLAPHAQAGRPHLVFSVSKSITGMLAGIAVGDGLLDPEAKVTDYVKVKRGGAYATTRVRHLLDMTASLDFAENYLDTTGAFARYRRSTLWNPQQSGRHETMLDVLASLKPGNHRHGQVYQYASPTTDMMGLVLEAAVGRRFHAYLGDRLWAPMGARGAAHVTVDRIGAARAAGGMCVTARDLARFGQLVLDGGATADGRQLIPASWIADMRENGDREAWMRGNDAHVFPDGRYRSFWYNAGDERDCFCAIGLHGQFLWIDPASRMVLVKMSSRPVPSDDALTVAETRFLGQVARGL